MPYSSTCSSSSYINLRKWAESDAQFVRSLSSAGLSNRTNNENRLWRPPPSPAVVDSFSCRQIYLRSYTFSKKETMPEKTIKCFGSFKRNAIHHLDCFPDDFSDGSGSFSSGKEYKRKMILKKKKKKKMMMKGRSVFFFIFHRLLPCRASFDFADGGRRGTAVHAM